MDCGTPTRRCHSAAQRRDIVTKDSDAARAPWDLFAKGNFRWVHDPMFESARNCAKRGPLVLEGSIGNEEDIPRDPKHVDFGNDTASQTRRC